MLSVIEALLLLTPYDIDRPKLRIGPRGDGGYIFADMLIADQPVLSYGIATECGFDLDFAQRGHKVFMFDHTIEGVDVVHQNMRFIREGVAGRTDEGGRVYSIADHLRRHDIRGDRLLMKMDVEGAEFDAFVHLPDEVLARFAQIVVEVHSLDRLEDEVYRQDFVETFRKINSLFTLFHVHANNFDGPATFDIVGGLPVPRIIELSYVRSSSVTRTASRTLYPTSVDFPNTDQKDKLLWIFPFLPTSLSSESFRLCAQRVELLEVLRTNGIRWAAQ